MHIMVLEYPDTTAVLNLVDLYLGILVVTHVHDEGFHTKFSTAVDRQKSINLQITVHAKV
jgi:hypothetical protein